MSRRPLSARSAALLLSILSLSGCAGLGTMGDVFGGPSGTSVSGEVRRVDERRQAIQVRTAYGRTQTVDFDRNTRVLYRQQRYPVRSLEPGDVVSMPVQRHRYGGLYTDVIYVERSVRERRDSRYPDDRRSGDRFRGREQTLQGRVARIDHKAGWFELREDSRGTYLVTLPPRAGSGVVKHFRRLRRGDFVRLQGEVLNRGRVELRRFR